MNIEKKINFQEKRIIQLEEENEDLRNELEEYKEKVRYAEEQLNLAEETIAEFNDLSKSLRKYKEEYEAKVNSVKLMAKEYKKALESHIKL